MKISIHKKPQVIVTVILLAWGSISRAQSKSNQSPKQIAETTYWLPEGNSGDTNF